MRRALVLALFLFAPLGALAALIPQNTGALELGMTPQYPRPGDVVTLVVNNTLGDAETATYAWSVDGAPVLSGIGKTSYTLTAPAAGQAEIVDVVVTGRDGVAEGEVSTTVNPATVDLVWEGQSTVPPFYIGRPLPNGASRITVLAVPHIVVLGASAPAASLVYSWKVNGVPRADLSGYGKSAAVVAPPLFDESFSVSVHAATPDGRGAGDGAITIAPQTPRALIYENAPLLGIRFERAISSAFKFAEDETSFTAFPLFAGNPGGLSYQWTLDSTPFSVDPARPLDVTFRKTGSGSGAHVVRFSFSDPSSFLDTGESSFTLAF